MELQNHFSLQQIKKKRKPFIHSLWFEHLTWNLDLRKGQVFRTTSLYQLNCLLFKIPNSSQRAPLELFPLPFLTAQWDEPYRHELLPNNTDEKACVIWRNKATIPRWLSRSMVKIELYLKSKTKRERKKESQAAHVAVLSNLNVIGKNIWMLSRCL